MEHVVEMLIVFARDGILGNPAVMVPLVAWVLTLIPGPFRGIAEGVVKWLLEQARARLEATQQAKAEAAVRSAEDRMRPAKKAATDALSKQRTNDRALAEAIEDARRLGVLDDAEPRVRAAFRRLKAAGEVA